MKLTASAAMNTRENSMKLGGFSKMWKVNDQGIVFYPITLNEETHKYDLLVGAVWGHQIDMKALGLKCTFIPTTSEINERGEPINPDVTYQFSQIAKLFIDGMKEKEKAEINAKDWDGMPMTALQKALEDVEKKYDTKNNMQAIGPAVKRMSYLITTECLYVPVENDRPQPDKARLVTQNLSNDRIAKLQALLNNSAFRPDTSLDENGQPKELWLEVGYTFTSARNDKGEAGRADPQGTSPEMRMSRRYPTEWDAIRPRLSSLPKDSETIKNRNYSYRAVPESAVMNAIRTYTVLNSNVLSSLTEEGEEQLLRNAAVLDTLLIKVKSKPELQKKIDDAVNEYRATKAGAVPTEDGVPFTGPTAAEQRDADVAGVVAQYSSAAPSIEDLMRGRVTDDGETGLGVDDDAGVEGVQL